ncbi:hypothetical protein JHK85_000334 [Glycine max]|nr:hypothetical protein JHK85_000334 [Glycine max]
MDFTQREKEAAHDKAQMRRIRAFAVSAFAGDNDMFLLMELMTRAEARFNPVASSEIFEDLFIATSAWWCTFS